MKKKILNYTNCNSPYFLVNQPAFEGGQVAIKHNDIISNEDVYVPITIDDDEGYEQHYDAFVLYADEDREFVEEMINRLGGMFQVRLE